MNIDYPILRTTQGRQRALTAALNITRGTVLAPMEYEQQLLNQFVSGELTIDDVLALLEAQEKEASRTALPPGI
jgi:hypothetical protein